MNNDTFLAVMQILFWATALSPLVILGIIPWILFVHHVWKEARDD